MWMKAAVTAVVLCTCGMAQAQGTAGGDAAKPTRMAKDADPDWQVVAVRPSNPSDTKDQHVDLRGRHVLFGDTTVEQFLLLGYFLQKSQLTAEPDWAKTERWDVDGVPDAEGQPNVAQIQALMRKILTERFGLKAHHEQRELPMYALTVAKNGPKMRPNTSDPDGMLDQQNDESGNGRDVERVKNASMSELVLILEYRVGRPVVDQTGLKGRYDFNLQWTTDEARMTDSDAPPGIFTAIQQQLGLKLEPVKAPADVMVVDKIERPGVN